jgi:hypothetical protein
VAHDVVLASEQFGLAVAGILNEDAVAVGDAALDVGFRD